MYLSIENITCPKEQISYTFQCLNNSFFQKQYETRYISTLVNSMDPEKPADLVINSADPDQLASEEASWSGSTLFSMQDVSS